MKTFNISYLNKAGKSQKTSKSADTLDHAIQEIEDFQELNFYTYDEPTINFSGAKFIPYQPVFGTRLQLKDVKRELLPKGTKIRSNGDAESVMRRNSDYSYVEGTIDRTNPDYFTLKPATFYKDGKAAGDAQGWGIEYDNPEAWIEIIQLAPQYFNVPNPNRIKVKDCRSQLAIGTRIKTNANGDEAMEEGCFVEGTVSDLPRESMFHVNGFLTEHLDGRSPEVTAVTHWAVGFDNEDEAWIEILEQPMTLPSGAIVGISSRGPLTVDSFGQPARPKRSIRKWSTVANVYNALSLLKLQDRPFHDRLRNSSDRKFIIQSSSPKEADKPYWKAYGQGTGTLEEAHLFTLEEAITSDNNNTIHELFDPNVWSEPDLHWSEDNRSHLPQQGMRMPLKNSQDLVKPGTHVRTNGSGSSCLDSPDLVDGIVTTVQPDRFLLDGWLVTKDDLRPVTQWVTLFDVQDAWIEFPQPR
jgi:hypothetical protein